MEERAIFRMDFEGSEKILEQMARIRDASEQLKEQNKDLAKEAKDGNLEAAKSYEANRVQIARNNKEIRELTKTYDEGTKAQQNNTGSLAEMRKQLRQMVTAYDNLSKEQRENTSAGRDLQKNIASITKELAQAEGATGRHQRKVGSYEEAINTAGMSIFEMRTQLRELQKVSQEDLSPEQVQKLEQAMGQLRDATDKANARIKVQAMDDIPALVASLQGVVAASQLVVGSMALFGIEDERVKKLTQTMVQLVGVSQALQTVNQLIASGQAAALIVKVKTIAATTAQAVATKAVTAAQWLWNKAMMANPVIAIVAGLIALTAGVYSLTRALKRSREETDDLTNSNEALIRSYERKGDQLAFEIKLMQALGVSRDEIAQKTRQMLRLELQRMELAEQQAAIDLQNGKITAQQRLEIIQATTEANRRYQLFIAEQIRLDQEKMERDKENAKKRADLEREESQRREIERKRQEERDAAAAVDRLKRSQKALLELAIIEAKSEQDRIEARIDLLKWETEQRLENEKLTQEERLLIEAQSIEKQLELENVLLQRQIDQQKEFDAQERQRLLELDEFERDLLEQKRRRDEAQLKFEQDITNARIETAFNLLFALQQIGGEQGRLAQAVKSLQKSAALVEININLQRELAAIRVAAAIQDAVIPGSGRLFAITRRIQAVSQAAAGAASVLALNKGGSVPGSGSRDTVPAMLTPGEGVLREQAMGSGDYWSLSGTPKQIASTLNQAYGGVEFRNRGGTIGSGQARSSTRSNAQELNQEKLIEAYKNITIVTTVEDINAGVNREAIRNDIATYG